MSRLVLVAAAAAALAAPALAEDACVDTSMTQGEMQAYVDENPKFKPLMDAGACNLVAGAVKGGFSCMESFLNSVTIQSLSAGVEGNLCQFCATECADAGDWCCGAPKYYKPVTYNGCECEDEFEHDGETLSGCTEKDSEGAAWCKVKADPESDCAAYEDDAEFGTFDYCVIDPDGGPEDAEEETEDACEGDCCDFTVEEMSESWVNFYNYGCTNSLGLFDSMGIDCDTELADIPEVQSLMSGVSGKMRDACPRTCGCEGMDSSCVDMTDEEAIAYNDKLAPLIGLGGCGALDTMAVIGLDCDSELADSPTIQGMSPGLSGSVREVCGATCGGCIEGTDEGETDAPVCADMTDAEAFAYNDKLAPLIGMGGCGALDTMAVIGLDCDSELADSPTIQGMSPGLSGSVREVCGATCGGCIEGIVYPEIPEEDGPHPCTESCPTTPATCDEWCEMTEGCASDCTDEYKGEFLPDGCSTPCEPKKKKTSKKKKSKVPKKVSKSTQKAMERVSSKCRDTVVSLVKDCKKNLKATALPCVAKLVDEKLSKVKKMFKKEGKSKGCKALQKDLFDEVQGIVSLHKGDKKTYKKLLKGAPKNVEAVFKALTKKSKKSKKN